MAYNMSDPVVYEIVSARITFLINFPFFGSLSIRLDLVDASKWCKTMTTDGRNLYYNRDWVKSLSRQKLIFAVGHQVLHCVYDHIGRRGQRNKELWDMATDYLCNYTLIKEKIGEPPEKALYNEKYSDELSAEEIYKLLEENSTTIQMPMDMHMDQGGDAKDENGQTVQVTVMGDENGPPQLSEADVEKIRNEVKAAVINAAQNSAGKLPLGIQRMLENLTEPKMDWRQLLETHIQSAIKDDYSFMRFSKKTWAMGGRYIIPGQTFLDTIDILCCVDVSGSIGDEQIRDFLSEVKGIMEMFKDFKLTLWSWDTEVHSLATFSMSNADDILKWTPAGGGGTDFTSSWNLIRGEHELSKEVDMSTASKLVVFTDGYIGGWGEEVIDTLWIIHSNPGCQAPYGTSVEYTEKG